MSSEGTNPIIPNIWDIALVSLGLLAVALFILTIVSIVRSKISPTMKLVCALLVLAMPFLGCIVWFASKRSLERSVSANQLG
ncbi:PLD nuclease N-terminal domain-containing protein [Renibacterium salmoninarum]|nr:PLD nuclease N-terminal domain-containing protein [Renibacterium salmoninarum]